MIPWQRLPPEHRVKKHGNFQQFERAVRNCLDERSVARVALDKEVKVLVNSLLADPSGEMIPSIRGYNLPDDTTPAFPSAKSIERVRESCFVTLEKIELLRESPTIYRARNPETGQWQQIGPATNMKPYFSKALQRAMIHPELHWNFDFDLPFHPVYGWANVPDGPKWTLNDEISVLKIDFYWSVCYVLRPLHD